MTETSQTKTHKDESPAHVKSKKRDRSASEDRLIHAGLEMFSKLGFDGATTRMIAKKADVNESLIARYFDGKEGLLVAIIEKFLEEMNTRELPYPLHDTLADELEAYVKDRIQEGCTHEDFAKIIFSQALVNKKFKKRVTETIPMQLDARLIARMEMLAAQGKIKAGANVEELCQDIDTYMDGMFFFECILHETTKEELVKRTVRFVRLYAKLYEPSAK
ncbi:TetR/AcrR family transcriptional regulator [Bdellovibrio sp. BCCA]|uniref:TetR/AcrR family transcriptional regulator n=1 Tax=Bdellovibrio sp. BCCA TaxID=3136281 RepID=UPI0030F0DF65